VYRTIDVVRSNCDEEAQYLTKTVEIAKDLAEEETKIFEPLFYHNVKN
jgi:hypothetical protein